MGTHAALHTPGALWVLTRSLSSCSFFLASAFAFFSASFLDFSSSLNLLILGSQLYAVSAVTHRDAARYTTLAHNTGTQPLYVQIKVKMRGGSTYPRGSSCEPSPPSSSGSATLGSVCRSSGARHDWKGSQITTLIYTCHDQRSLLFAFLVRSSTLS